MVVFSGDDHQALIWDIQPMPKPIEVPILAYAAEGEINQVTYIHRPQLSLPCSTVLKHTVNSTVRTGPVYVG